MMGALNKRLFLKVQNDGALVVTATNTAKPKSAHFERTQAWFTHVEFEGVRGFLTAGHFDTFATTLNHFNIPALATLPKSLEESSLLCYKCVSET